MGEKTEEKDKEKNYMIKTTIWAEYLTIDGLCGIYMYMYIKR